MPQTQILGLDIGSETIKAIIAEPSAQGKVILRAGITRPSKGLRRGVVVDMEQAASSIRSVLEEIRGISKSAAKNIYLRVGGSDVKVQNSRGITAVARANSEIYKDDVDRVVQASEAINLPSNRMILHTIKKEFIVDGVGDIQDPLGMIGARLEVISLIIDAFHPNVKNLSKCIEMSGGSISGLIFGPIASALSVLTNNQKELGVVSIDIGYGTTGITVYEEDKLLHTKVFPVGAGHITNDLATTLKVPPEVAEKIKLSYGYAVSNDISSKDKVELEKIDPELKGSPTRKYISQIIESRLSELAEFINAELHSIGKERQLPSGAVITGGGAKLPGIVELMRNELKLNAQIGLPNTSAFKTDSSNMIKFLESPEYTCVLGLILWSQKASPRKLSYSGNAVMDFLKKFLP